MWGLSARPGGRVKKRPRAGGASVPEGFAEYLLSFRPSQQKGHGLLAAPFLR